MTESEPFSRVVRVDALPKDGQSIAIEASPAERDALASFYKLPEIAALSASLSLNRAGRGGVRVTGAVHGELTQICVVSLEAFPATVDEDIDVRFAPRSEDDASRGRSETPPTFSIVGEDEPDLIVEGKIDLGALAAEFFALGLDPYPRKPGATFDPPNDDRTGVAPYSALQDAARRGSN